jgi:hypothetical protein
MPCQKAKATREKGADAHLLIQIRLEAIASLHLLGTLLQLLLLDLRQLAVVLPRHALHLLLRHRTLLRKPVHIDLEVGSPTLPPTHATPKRLLLLLLLLARRCLLATQITIALVQMQGARDLQVPLEHSHALDLILGLQLPLLRP